MAKKKSNRKKSKKKSGGKKKINKKKINKKKTKKKTPVRPTTRTRSLGGPSRARTVAVAPAGDSLSELLDHLESVREQLLEVDSDSLDAAKREQWREQVSQVSLAITRVSNLELSAISEEFSASLPRINSATGKLASDLNTIKTANEVVTAVAEVIGVIATVAKLLAA
jgi:hypothetical protein